MTQMYKATAKTTIDGSFSAVATSIAVADAAGLPRIQYSADEFYLMVTGAGTELIRVAAISGNNLTVVRGELGTTPFALTTGDVVEIYEPSLTTERGRGLPLYADPAIANQSEASTRRSVRWLADAVIAAGNRATIELSSGLYHVNSSMVLPSGISLRFQMGAVVDVAAGATLTVQGAIEAGPWQIFAGDGEVVGLPGAPLCPEWFGARRDGMTNDSHAFVKAMSFVASTGGTLHLSSGSYFLATAFDVPMSMDLDFMVGARLRVRPGVSVNINGGIVAGPRQIFDLCYRLSSTAYSVGERVIVAGNIYECASAGVTSSGPGPSGVGSGISDGTVTWDFVFESGAAGLRQWGNGVAYLAGDRATTEWGMYECVTGGLSASDGVGPAGLGSAVADGTAIWKYLAPTGGGTAWQPSTAYSVDDLICSGSNVYRCVLAGTSSSSDAAPIYPGASIVDGTARWAYVTRTVPVSGAFLYWVGASAYRIGARVANGSGVYECVADGTSAPTAIGPTGTGSDIFDGTAHWRYVGVVPTSPVAGNPPVERIFPQWWGARGDYVVDETTPVQNAIDFVLNAAVGMTAQKWRLPTVFVPSGRYLFYGDLIVVRGSGGGVVIDGGVLGRAHFHHRPAAPRRALLTFGVRPTVGGAAWGNELIGISLEATGHTSAGVVVRRQSRFAWRENAVGTASWSSPAKAGVVVDGCMDCLFDGGQIAAVSYGMHFRDSDTLTTTVTVEGVYFSSVVESCFRAESGTTIWIRECCPQGARFGLHVPSGRSSGLTIERCHFEANAEADVKVEGVIGALTGVNSRANVFLGKGQIDPARLCPGFDVDFGMIVSEGDYFANRNPLIRQTANTQRAVFVGVPRHPADARTRNLSNLDAGTVSGILPGLSAGLDDVGSVVGTRTLNLQKFGSLKAVLTGGLVVNPPDGTPVRGQFASYIFEQDSAGGHSVEWGPVGVPAGWTPDTAYSAGQRVLNGGRQYEVVIGAGRSSSSGGPAGTDGAIFEVPDYWSQYALYVVGDVVINAALERYRCIAAGTSGASAPSGAGGGSPIVDGSVEWIYQSPHPQAMIWKYLAPFETSWSDAGNSGGKRASVTFLFDGERWIQVSYSPWW